MKSSKTKIHYDATPEQKRIESTQSGCGGCALVIGAIILGILITVSIIYLT